MKNYYEILEVSENASQEVIEKAYKILAKKYHPDIQPQDKIYWAENKFKEITIAYKTLSNDKLRNEYNLEIGLGNNLYSQYDNLYDENEKLKREVHSLKFENESEKYKRKKEKEEQKEFRRNLLNPKRYLQLIGTMLYNETKKDSGERSRDLKALILTVIIIAIIIFVFLKVPVLRNILFP